MKNTELRIGNLVYALKSTLDPVVIGNDYNIYFDRDYSPIPLTQEWLLKFGFQNKKDKKYKQKLWFIDNLDFEFRLRQSVNGYYNLFMFDIYFQKESPTKYNIYYVHQLQNLYFALTEKELDVKL
jgi:hypothetical protein